ncbi:Gst Glutathione S-transferase [Burkholderiaceae bacterium]
MLRIWGRITSINVRKAVWTAQELGLEFERIDAGGAFGITKTPEYIAMNPNSVVPTLVDGEFTLWESNVVVRYLCAKHALGHLYPVDLQERFNAERWMDWQQTTFSPSGRDAFWQIIRIPEPERDMQKVAASISSTEILLDRFEAHLSTTEYVAGSKLTMADIPMTCEIHRWFGLNIPSKTRPYIEAWYAKMLARPGSKNVLTLPLS